MSVVGAGVVIEGSRVRSAIIFGGHKGGCWHCSSSLSPPRTGVLDAMTNGGLGVAFFAPFSPARYFLPFRPIQVSPISIRAFFTHAGIEVLESEPPWIWLPFLGLAFVMHPSRRFKRLASR